MKKKHCCCEYVRQRNLNLRREVIARIGTRRSLADIFSEVSASRAERFYISEERALLLIKRKMKTGSWDPDMFPMRRRMMEVIEEKVAELRRVDPGMSLREAVFEVVNSPAPSFFLTPGSVRVIFYSSKTA